MADAGAADENPGQALLGAINNLNAVLGPIAAEFTALETAREQRSARSRGGWDDEKDHHCDCPVCAALPEGPPDGEPGQDPTTWHWPVATNRQHVVLSRLYHWRDVFNFMRRHEEGLRSPYGLFRVQSLDIGDDAMQFSFEGTRDTPPPEDSFMNKGVILDLRLWANRWERYVGVADELLYVYSSDDGATENIAKRQFVVVDVVAHETEPNANRMLAPEWNWDYHGKVAAATIVSAAELTRGAAAYKFEFYTWPRCRLVSLRKLVDQCRAAPPGFTISRGKLVRARRTMRGTREPRIHTGLMCNKSAAPKPVDKALLSVLFDRTTVPDDVFRRIVSYHGSLCPRRPWLEAARERGDSSDSGSGSESES